MIRLLFFLLIFLFGCNNSQPKKIVAAVVSAKKEASEIGIKIIEKGGNAFDAMIATDLALAVCYPSAGNIGGGGFMIYRTSDGQVGTLDYREKAPEKSNKDMFLDSDGNVIKGKSTIGGLSVGVPGTIAGLFEVHKRFGSLPFETLIEPAIQLARKGYVPTKNQLKNIELYKDLFVSINGKKTLFASNFKEGDRIINEALAKTLEVIKENGKDGFYKGEIAKHIVNSIKESGGILNINDLNNYTPKWRTPIYFKYKDLDIYSMGPPSSGGICLAQILSMIEPYNLNQYPQNSIKAIQLLVEAQRRSYSDRSKFLGDSDYNNVPIDYLINKDYLKNRMKSFSWEKASISESINPGDISIFESEETTHYSIVDNYGNAVGVTTTLNSSFGSKLFVEQGGFFLNNQMDDFSIKIGQPNLYGLIGGDVNSVQPNKRMLSSMTPTIVEKDGKLSLVLGTPGGSTIITSVLQTILNIYEYGMPVQKAVNSPRFHHQWFPDNIVFEPNAFGEKLIKDLKRMGYKIDPSKNKILGRVDAIYINQDNLLTAAADPRGDDNAQYLRE